MEIFFVTISKNENFWVHSTKKTLLNLKACFDLLWWFMNTNQRDKLCRDQMWLKMSCSHGGKLTFYSLWYFTFIWNPAKEANRWWCNWFQSNIFPRHIYQPPPLFYFILCCWGNEFCRVVYLWCEVMTWMVPRFPFIHLWLYVLTVCL